MEILSSMLSQLGINESIFVMLGLFIGTFAVFHVLVLGKLSATLIERDQRTAGREDAVHHLAKELESTRGEIHASLQKARIEANTEFVAIKNKALEQQRGVVQLAREKATDEMQKTRKVVADQFTQEIKKLEQEVPMISKAILERLLSTPNEQASKKTSLSSSSEVE